MGSRVRGRVKKKSIKAASHSAMGSKRKLSRMGKKQKKDHAGLDATFIGRSACLKRLQVTLKDFRRLCILKGIYPREPRGRAPKNKKGQVFYHIKDVKALAHEPLLAKFREFRAFMKKLRKSSGRNEKDEAARKDSVAPSYTLNHLVRERYPRFVDALSDLDDALAMVYLFAALPSTEAVASKTTKKSQILAAQWGAYCSTMSAITKSFVSVKGIYVEAIIQNTKICWVIPHAFTQNIPQDVDFRVMSTFFEFYETLLGFVMYKLYNDIGVRFPLPLTAVDYNKASSLLSANLQVLQNSLNSTQGTASNAVSETIGNQSVSTSAKEENISKSKLAKLKTVDEALKQIHDEDDDVVSDMDDDIDIAGPLKAALESVDKENAVIIGASQTMTLDEESSKRKRLFSGLTFFISREVPKGYLELVCLSFGGKVGWEGIDSAISVRDPSITHHIVDRPILPSSFNDLPKSRDYVQPQWVLDSANFHFLLPIKKYAIGCELPPHLSPWVDDAEEGYTPAYAEEIERLKNGQIFDEGRYETGVNKIEEIKDVEDKPEGSNADMDEAKESLDTGMEFGEGDGKINKAQLILTTKRKDEEESHALAVSMMTKKASRLYKRMQHGIEEKQAAVTLLHKRRKDIEACKGKNKREDGKTMLKAKVERLRIERRAIHKAYDNTGGLMKKRKKSRN